MVGIGVRVGVSVGFGVGFGVLCVCLRVHSQPK